VILEHLKSAARAVGEPKATVREKCPMTKAKARRDGLKSLMAESDA
jgi:hypothetical protein